MHEAFVKAGRRQIAFGEEQKADGINVANREPFLNLLGAPGAGKSTFLRRLGLEALLSRAPSNQATRMVLPFDGKYEHARLPVYVELRVFQSKPVDLVALITEEFATCGFPDSRVFVEAALERGQLLVLLDGLDEVSVDRLKAVIDHVRAFVDRYGAQEGPSNRFVTSCRTAHYKNAFPRFTDVVLADFSDEQIGQFAKNWFSSLEHSQAETATRFVATLKEPANAPTLELARTPLLLVFLCLTFTRDQVLPRVRAVLYRRALDLLLREWAAERLVHNDPIYQELNTDLEVDMLAELAEELFQKDRFFFNHERATAHIRKFMGEQLDAPKSLDAGKILQAIEVQQGLIVRRAQDTYSFSHLTIQEYLTAKRLWDDRKNGWKPAVKKHLADPRWWVVFELLAGMGDADKLLQAMANSGQRQLDRITKTIPEVANLFQWVAAHESSASDRSPTDGVCRRSWLLMLAVLASDSLDGSIHGGIPPGVELIFDCSSLIRLVGCVAGSNPPDDIPDRVSTDWGGNIKRVQSVLGTLSGLYIAGSSQNAFAKARSVLLEKSTTGGQVRRILDLPDHISTTGYESVVQYLTTCQLVWNCRNAAYRVSTATWDEICNLMLLHVPQGRTL